MAVKTITIDLEAYEILARRKRRGQSFSQVIKERLGGGATAGELLARVREAPMSADALDAVDRLIRRRRGDFARAARP